MRKEQAFQLVLERWKKFWQHLFSMRGTCFLNRKTKGTGVGNYRQIKGLESSLAWLESKDHKEEEWEVRAEMQSGAWIWRGFSDKLRCLHFILSSFISQPWMVGERVSLKKDLPWSSHKHLQGFMSWWLIHTWWMIRTVLWGNY